MARFLPALRRSGRITRIEAPVPPGFTSEQKVVLQSYYDTLAHAGIGLPGADRDAAAWDPQQAVINGYLRVVWVFKAVEAIAGNSSRLPFQLKAGEDVIDDHPLYRLLNHGKANPLESGRQFRKRLSAQVLLSRRGAFVEVTKSIGGDPTRLDLLPPARTRPVPGTGTDLISHYEMTQKDGTVRKIAPEKVRWVREPHPTDPFAAVTPLDAARMSVELDFFARLYNVQFMRNDGRPGGVLGVEGDMEEEDMDRIESRFGKGPVEAGKLSVIAGQVSYVDTSRTPRDSSYQVASRNARDEIVVAFGTPLSQMGDASGKTFANADAEAYMFWTQTMTGHNDMIAAAFDPDSDEDYVGELDVSSVEVLQRAEIARREEMRKEVKEGLRSIWSYAQEADIDVESTPQTRALWIPAGSTPVAATEADQDVLGQAPPATGGQPNGGPGGGGPGGAPAAPTAPTGAPATTDGLPRVPESNVVPITAVKAHLAVERKEAPRERRSEPPAETFADVEKKTGTALDALAARQAGVVAARLASPKARKGTKHWAPTGPDDTRAGTKSLNAPKVVDAKRWAAEADTALASIVADGTEAVAAQMVADLGLDVAEGKARRMADSVREAAAAAAAEALWVARTSVTKHSDRLAEIIQEREDDGATVEQIVDAVRAYADQFRRGWSQVVAVQVAQVVVEGTRVRIGNLPRSQRDIMRTWITRQDERVRPTHRAVHGQKRRAGQPFTIDGATVRYPGDPLAPHHVSVNCRCRVMFTSRQTRRIIPTPPTETARNPRLARKVLTWAPLPGPPVRPMLAVKTIRHVRTAAGVAKFGQPIGEVIVRDLPLTISHLDAGVRGQRVTATDSDGSKVGHLTWLPDGRIQHVEVVPARRRQGVATELLRQARRIDPRVHHNEELSDDGRPWAAATGLRSVATPEAPTVAVEAAGHAPAAFLDPDARRNRYGDTIEAVAASVAGLFPRARVRIDSVTVDEATAFAQAVDEMTRRYPAIAHDVAEVEVSDSVRLEGGADAQVAPIADGAALWMATASMRGTAAAIVGAIPGRVPAEGGLNTVGAIVAADLPVAVRGRAAARFGVRDTPSPVGPEASEVMQRLMFGTTLHEMAHVIDAHGHMQQALEESGAREPVDEWWTGMGPTATWPTLVTSGGPAAQAVFAAADPLSEAPPGVRVVPVPSPYGAQNPAEWFAEMLSADILDFYPSPIDPETRAMLREAAARWASREIAWADEAMELKTAMAAGITDRFGPGSVVWEWAAL